jgi:hypothetical protein
MATAEVVEAERSGALADVRPVLGQNVANQDRKNGGETFQ